MTEADLEEKIYKNPRHIFVNIPSEDGKSHPQWKKVQESYRKAFDYFEIEENSIISRLGIKQRPALVYFPKSLAKKDLLKTIFHSNEDFRAINH